MKCQEEKKLKEEIECNLSSPWKRKWCIIWRHLLLYDTLCFFTLRIIIFYGVIWVIIINICPVPFINWKTPPPVRELSIRHPHCTPAPGYCLNNPTDEATCTCIYTKNLYIHIGMAINESDIQYTCAILGVFSFVHTLNSHEMNFCFLSLVINP